MLKEKILASEDLEHDLLQSPEGQSELFLLRTGRVMVKFITILANEKILFSNPLSPRSQANRV